MSRTCNALPVLFLAAFSVHPFFGCDLRVASYISGGFCGGEFFFIVYGTLFFIVFVGPGALVIEAEVRHFVHASPPHVGRRGMPPGI